MTKIRISGSSALRFVLFSLALCMPAFGASSASASEAAGYFAVESFTWKEFDDGGARLLRENGPLFGIGFSYQAVYSNNLIFTPAIELFGGKVDYDGQACKIGTTDCIASTTDVRYFGLKLVGDLGYRFGDPGNLSVEPFIGLGLRAWVRDIGDGTAANGTATAGYSEEWFVLNGRVGAKAAMGIGGESQVFVQGGVKLPIYNSTTAYVSDIGFTNDTTVEPGKKISFFAETGIRLNNFKASLFYESLRFRKSNNDFSINALNGLTYIFWQPESTMDLYGVKLGVVF